MAIAVASDAESSPGYPVCDAREIPIEDGIRDTVAPAGV